MDDILRLSQELKDLRDHKDALSEQLKEVNARIEDTETALAEAMVSKEMQNFTRDGFTFYLRDQLFASAVKDRREELHDWLKENGYGGLVKEVVHANSLRAFVKEQLEEADELPEGLRDLVNVYEKTTVGIRKK